MPLTKSSPCHQGRCGLIQIKQAEEVGDRGPLHTYRFSRLLMGQTEFINEAT